MSVETKEIDGILLVGFGVGKLLDEQVIQEVGRRLIETIEEVGDEKQIVLSFRGVSFMSSAMLGRLVMFHKKCKAADVDLKLASIAPEIAEVFKITKMNKLFDIRKDEEAAMKAFQKKGWFG